MDDMVVGPRSFWAAESVPEVEDDMDVDDSHITSLPPAKVTEISTGPPAKPSGSPRDMAPRGYQYEMFYESLRRNVIVVMDTGSGKTQIAVLRIQAELDKSPRKIVWFLAPTIALCEQQCEVIRLQNPTVHVEVLTGKGSVDTWSKETWDKILSEARVVVATFQVLLDALAHGFVQMETLSLLVVDEAHNCMGKSPLSQIMTKFYHPAKNGNKSVPAVLGLTASPVVRSDPGGIQQLEEALDAHCITPVANRNELLKLVNRPELVYAPFKLTTHSTHSPNMLALRSAYQHIDIKTDPAVKRLMGKKDDNSRQELRKVIFEHDTYTHRQLGSFWGRSKEILDQLGPWAVDSYISKVVGGFLSRVSSDKVGDGNWLNEDKVYLADCLSKISLSPVSVGPVDPSHISDRASVLIEYLVSAPEEVAGIIFVKERATVSVLVDLLLASPDIRERYRIGSMVGTSKGRSGDHNFYEPGNGGLDSLQKFRQGNINLLVATSVLEEGIDVPACNLVICFDQPANLKSFIQRRGRARMKRSSLVVFHEHSDNRPAEWEALEREMKAQYQQEREELSRLRNIEDEASGDLSFKVPSTGARLDIDNAKGHLEHLCRVASHGEYIDRRPEYIFHKISEDDDALIKATVILPQLFNSELRQWESGSAWLSQKNASKDAAYRAYVGLYKAGLVNDNLVPSNVVDDSMIERWPVEDEFTTYNAWTDVARAWGGAGDKWRHRVSLLDEEGRSLGEYQMIMSMPIPHPEPITIHHDDGGEWVIRIGRGEKVSHQYAMNLPDHTATIMALHFGHRMNVTNRDQVIKLCYEEPISRDQIGGAPFDPTRHHVNMPFLVRDREKVPWELTAILDSKPSASEVQLATLNYLKWPANVPYVALRRASKQVNFLRRPETTDTRASPKRFQYVLPMSWVKVDEIPRRVEKFAMLIPSMMYKLEALLTVAQVSENVLKPVGITNPQLIREAITTRKAQESVDYERLEFLGDSILKFCAVLQVSAQNLRFPEGFLSMLKDRQIKNANLINACVRTDLAKYILNDRLNAPKWRPTYSTDLLVGQSHPRKIPMTKILADVVESIIGASYLDGGMPKALMCISMFLGGHEKGQLKWLDVPEARKTLFNHATGDVELPMALQPLEEFIEYSFKKKSLLIEAMTHPSHAPDARWESYERLEFLGDSVLDHLLVTKTFKEAPAWPHTKLHLLRGALASTHFLGCMVLAHGLKTEESVVNQQGQVEIREVTLPLWKFMRHCVPSIGVEQEHTLERWEGLRDDIMKALTSDKRYPWALLARLGPKKIFANVLEALLGAVWVDSGSMEMCEKVLRRFSITTHLERFIRDDVNMMHPKEELMNNSGGKSLVYHHKTVNLPDGRQERECTLTINDRQVAHVTGAQREDEAGMMAADMALERLLAENELDGEEAIYLGQWAPEFVRSEEESIHEEP